MDGYDQISVNRERGDVAKARCLRKRDAVNSMQANEPNDMHMLLEVLACIVTLDEVADILGSSGNGWSGRRGGQGGGLHLGRGKPCGTSWSSPSVMSPGGRSLVYHTVTRLSPGLKYCTHFYRMKQWMSKLGLCHNVTVAHLVYRVRGFKLLSARQVCSST